MGKKISAEVEKLCQSLASLVQEFEGRKQAGGIQLERAASWFTEAVKQGTFALYEKVVLMLESSL